VFWIDGGDNTKFHVHETILERKWSGRLFIQEYREQPCMLLRFVWQDIKQWFTDSLRHLMGRETTPFGA